MSSFKSPELHVCGRIKTITDTAETEQSSFYVKMQLVEGEDWRVIRGNTKFETFQATSNFGVAALEHPFNIHYLSQNVRGWPRIIIEVWKVDNHGRHNLYGYGTSVVPMATGDYEIDINCWRPKGTWYDRFIGANSQLQHPGILASSLSRYGLRTFSSCRAKLQLNVIGRNFQLHGVVRQQQQ